VAALNTRVLRPGSSPLSDATARAVLETWRGLEDSMGMDLDVRTAAFIASGDTTLHFPGPSDLSLQQSSRAQRFAILLGVLWPRGVGARASALRAQNRFHQLSGTDRLLLVPLTEAEATVVDVQDSGWRRIVAEGLTTRGAVRLTN